MSKGKKRCYFCGCSLTNQNKTITTTFKRGWSIAEEIIWHDCCHACKARKDKKR